MFGARFPRAHQRWPWPLLVVLLLGLVIAGIGAFAYREQSAVLERQALGNLGTMARLKADAIARALAAEEARTRILSRAPTLIAFLQQGTGRTDGPERVRLGAFLEEARAAAGLENLLLMDDGGHRLLAAQEDRSGEAAWGEAARQAITAGAIVFVDLHRDPGNGRVTLGFVAPILAAGEPGRRALGAVGLDIAAPSFLGRELLLWPMASASSRTVLLSRDGGKALALGQFGGARDAPLELRPLPAAADAMAARALRGETAPAAATGLLGQPVLAASAAVPRTPWVLLVTMDRDEALAEATQLGIDTGLLGLAALVASIAFVVFLEQRRRLHAALAQMAHDRALQAAQTQFRAVFEQASIGIALVASDGRWLQVNRRLCDTLGYSEQELFARTTFELAHPDDRAPLRELIGELTSGAAENVTTERRYLRRDGGTVWAATAVRLVRQADGAPDYYIAVIEDVSDRHRAEQQLRASELRFRQVVESAPNAMLMSAPDGTIAMVNRQAGALFGYARDELLGQPIERLIPERYRQAHGGHHRAFLADPRPRKMGAGRELFGLRKDGSEVPVEIGITPIETEAGTMVLSTLVDITERKRQEEALRKSEEQLRQSQKMEAIGSLTGGMAHDFNNLLGIIIGNLDLAQPALEKVGDAGELVREALNAALRGADLTRRLLAFARRQPLRPQRVAISGLVAETVKLLSRTLGENIQISAELPERLWPVVVDPAQLEAALANLATNARDAMPSGGRLSITAANRPLDDDYAALHAEVKPGDYVMIEVSDTGTGMPPGVLAHIFEPFFTTKERGKGTGLGLAMVFGFMKQSGGHINVYSEPGVGTTFRLYLPRSREEAAEAREPEIPAPARASGETVLVVEDNEALRRVVARQVTDLGYRVIAVQDAAEALSLLERERVALLFTDVVMPGEMDGFGLAEHVLAHWPDVRVVLTSGFPETTTNRKLRSLAASTRLLSKPYRKTELAATLRAALDA